MAGTVDWDEPLPPTRHSQWTAWRDSLPQLRQIHLSRKYFPESLSEVSKVKLYVFSDASELAIAAVCYLLSHSPDGSRHISFAMGKAKVAPTSCHTIPV